MTALRTLATTLLLGALLAGCAHPPGGPRHAHGAGPAAGADRMEAMDRHMQTMREWHEKLAAARTPEERQALVAERAKLMHEGMAMMGGMGPGAMGRGPMAMGGPHGAADPETRQRMMEKRLEMMQSMMQMMMDRLPPPAAR